jgi:DNA ligase (NAD+)
MNNKIYFRIPSKCPFCKQILTIKKENDSEILFCINPLCDGKLLNKLNHFCGKKGLDIKGISKATLNKLIDWGWVGCLTDIFFLKNHQKEWITKTGFGEASVRKILASIEEHRTTTLSAFISSLGIPLIGQTAAKELTKHFNSYEDFRKAIDSKDYSFANIAGFGEEMNTSLKNFVYEEADTIYQLLIIKNPIVNSNLIDNNLSGKTITITGKLTTFKNRAELKEIILQHGGKVSESITAKTSFLINNDVNSSSSKNKAAQERGIPILSESDFIFQYLENH